MTNTASPRYEGLDSFRAFSAFGVVFFHIYISAGCSESLEVFVRLRDCALPLMVMASFYLATVSLLRKNDSSFTGFFSQRVKRLWLPLIFWSLIYHFLWTAFVPAVMTGEYGVELPPLTLFFTGYVHLWFLQFVFIGSLLIYPVVYWLKNKPLESRQKLFFLLIALAFFYAAIFHNFLKDNTDFSSINPDGDISIETFVSQTLAYFLYIPAAIGLALVSEKINRLYENPLLRRLSLAMMVVAMLVHVGTVNLVYTREIYALAVFLAVLQPWGKSQFKFVSKLAAHSYGIYILHFFPAQILFHLMDNYHWELSDAAVILLSLAAYLVSFAAAVAINKLPFGKWILPLVPVNAPAKEILLTEQRNYLPIKAT